MDNIYNILGRLNKIDTEDKLDANGKKILAESIQESKTDVELLINKLETEYQRMNEAYVDDGQKWASYATPAGVQALMDKAGYPDTEDDHEIYSVGYFRKTNGDHVYPYYSYDKVNDEYFADVFHYFPEQNHGDFSHLGLGFKTKQEAKLAFEDLINKLEQELTPTQQMMEDQIDEELPRSKEDHQERNKDWYKMVNDPKVDPETKKAYQAAKVKNDAHARKQGWIQEDDIEETELRDKEDYETRKKDWHKMMNDPGYDKETKNALKAKRKEHDNHARKQGWIQEGDSVMINGKEVDTKSLSVDGIDTGDHPDYVDAYYDAGQFTDGTPMSEEELEQMLEQHPEFIHDLITDHVSGMGDWAHDAWKDEQMELNEEISMNISANGDEDVINLMKKLAGMQDMSVSNEPADMDISLPGIDDMAALDQPCDDCAGGEIEIPIGEEGRDIEHANTPAEVTAPVSAAIPSGDDLHKEKVQDPETANRAANPLKAAKKQQVEEETVEEINESEELWNNYSNLLDTVKIKD